MKRKCLMLRRWKSVKKPLERRAYSTAATIPNRADVALRACARHSKASTIGPLSLRARCCSLVPKRLNNQMALGRAKSLEPPLQKTHTSLNLPRRPLHRAHQGCLPLHRAPQDYLRVRRELVLAFQSGFPQQDPPSVRQAPRLVPTTTLTTRRPAPTASARPRQKILSTTAIVAATRVVLLTETSTLLLPLVPLQLLLLLLLLHDAHHHHHHQLSPLPASDALQPALPTLAPPNLPGPPKPPQQASPLNAPHLEL